jgi:predicted TIM-barrel fold metal-dependent hydrolase
MAARHPDVAFDLFHLGVPYVREAVLIGKMFPNVTLNLCWNSVLSPELTIRMLDECLDMVPVNNIIAFGADYNLPVEKVYGHLKMAKEVVARSLAKRIRRGEFGHEEALRIAGMWFHGNPTRIYHL